MGLYRHRRFCGACLILLATLAWAEAPATHDWSPSTRPIWDAYYAHDFERAQRLALRLLREVDQERTRTDAATLHALCLLRSDTRADRQDGRTRLERLVADNPSLADDPECNLAYGIALTAQHETGHALDVLDHAVRGFARQDRPARQAAALVNLGRAWIAHGEWESMPSRFRIPLPRTAEKRAAIRREQLATIRDQLTELNQPVALAELDLAWAQHLLTSSMDDIADGVARLEELVAVEHWQPVHAEAAFALARHYDHTDRTADAVPLYRRLVESWSDARVHLARTRFEALSQPEIRLDLPQSIAPNTPATFGLDVRGLPRVRVEIRQVDVNEWLRTPGQRGRDRFLSESGSIRYVREFDTQHTDPLTWWNSTTLDAAPTCDLAAGTYVVIVRPVPDVDASAHTHKQLLVVSDLHAVAVVNNHNVAIGCAAENPPASGTVRFWMLRSFTPTRAPLRDGVAMFPLPNEARLMRDRDWIALIETDTQHAICRGTLPESLTAAATRPRVFLTGGPPTPAIGSRVQVAGLVLPPGAEDTLTLSWLDAFGDARITEQATPTGGWFSVSTVLDETVAGDHLRVVPRSGNRTLENAISLPQFDVPSPDRPRFKVEVNAPQHLRPGERLRALVHVRYPWGVAPRRCRVHCLIRVAELPTDDPRTAAQPVAAVVRRGRLDADGEFALWIPADKLGDPATPRIISIEPSVYSWDGRRGSGFAELIAGPQPVHAWISLRPATPKVGDRIHFGLHWFQPGGRPAIPYPRIEIVRDNQSIADLTLAPRHTGLTSEVWRATHPGPYIARTTLPASEDDPLPVALSFDVTEAPAAAAPPPAHAVGLGSSPAAPRLQLQTRPDRPELLFTESGEELHALLRTPADGLSIHTPPATQPGDTVHLFVRADDGWKWEWSGPIEATAATLPTLRTKEAQPTAWPGNPYSITVAPHSHNNPSTLVARLIPVVTAGVADHAPMHDRTTSEAPSLNVATSNGRVLTAPAVSDPVSLLSPALHDFLIDGMTMWTAARSIDNEPMPLQVPLPTQPGLYELRLAHVRGNQLLAQTAKLIDTRHGLSVALDVPRHLLVGDRALVALQLHNGCPAGVIAHVTFESDPGVALEAFRGNDSRPLDREPGADSFRIPLQANEDVWIYADAEAVSPGPADVRARVVSEHREAVAQQTCTVRDLKPPDRKARVHMRRSLFVWQPAEPREGPRSSPLKRGPILSPQELRQQLGPVPDEPLADESEDRPAERADWTWHPVSPEARLIPGQFLLVKEEWLLETPLEPSHWQQWVPATCDAVPRDYEEYPPIGPRRDRRRDRIAVDVPKLAPGIHAHQYFLAVVRPGACSLPPPTLRQGDRTIGIELTPLRTRPIVIAED